MAVVLWRKPLLRSIYGVYKLVGVISKWRKEKREAVIQKSEESKAVLKEMYEKTESSFESDEDNIGI